MPPSLLLPVHSLTGCYLCANGLLEAWPMLYRGSHVSLDGRAVWGRMDTCIRMAESLHCSPETITALLIGYQFSLVSQSCPTLWDPMDGSAPGLPVHHQLPELTQTHVHRVGDAIQSSHPLQVPNQRQLFFPLFFSLTFYF